MKTNENLRHEHQRAVATVMDIKEEYTDKLNSISSKYESLRQKQDLENMSL